MPKTVIDVPDGIWRWYEIGAHELGVREPKNPADGFIVEWKGQTGPDTLSKFFSGAAKNFFGNEVGFVRLWSVTDKGPSVVEKHETSVPTGFGFTTPMSQLNKAQFVQFEGLKGDAVADEDAGSPVVAVFANQDQRGENYDESQESVGVFLREAKSIKLLNSDIADLVAGTSNRFSEEGYVRGEAMKGLHQALADLGLR